ncbi:uncharacterized protein [Haliotis asinina]|uniref:uncharacterized protein n=1 Tax=Haliotis asinina TaxID=109174 RepID=UPI003531A632
MTELCHLLRIDKSRTTPYHPMGNGMCERFNRTLCNMLGTLDPDSKKNWKAHVGPLVHAYNCTRHETTSLSPFFLMFGRHPRLPVDLAFGLDIEPSKSMSRLDYTRSLRERLKHAYDVASASAKKAQSKQKTYYDHTARAAILEIGDRVLVKIVAYDGRHKLADRWESDVYVVLDQPTPSIPVFVVGKENGDGKKKTLHRNLLLPVGSLPGQEVPVQKLRKCSKASPASKTDPLMAKSKPVPKPRKQSKPSLKPQPAPVASDDGEDRDGDEELVRICEHTVDTSVFAGNTADRPTEDEVERELESGDNIVVTEEVDDIDHVSRRQNPSQEEAADADHDAHGQTQFQDHPMTAADTEEGQQAAAPQRQTPAPLPRRSTRARTQPKWMSGGEFALSAVAQPEWLVRANYLSSLLAQGVFGSQQHRASDAILDLITGKDK